MEPSAPPPWRVLETPSTDASPRPTAAEPAPASAIPSAVKVAAIGAAALVFVVVAVVVAVAGGNGDVRIDGGSAMPVASASGGPASPSADAGGAELVVEIVGAVPKPGVYRLPPGSRLVDLLRSAGGYGPRVDTARAEQDLNLAAPIKDGDHVRVPSRDDEIGEAVPSSAASAGGALLDVNTATQAQLEELPGVGPVTAQKIITAREEAPFGAVEELRSRGVLGEKTFEKLRPLLTVG
jgi:competence protein ComEA